MLYFSRLGHFGGSQSEGAARCREPLLRQQLLVLQRRHPQARCATRTGNAPVDGSLVGAIRFLL